MPVFDLGAIVTVPFPYTDRPVIQRRPALVLSSAAFSATHGLLWVVMITSSKNAGWHGDVLIPDHQRVGLPAPSLVRTAKLATIQSGDASLLGTLDPPTVRQAWELVMASMGCPSGVSWCDLK